MSTKKKRAIIIFVTILFLITGIVFGSRYIAKPSKAKLVTGLDDAFEYYRSGGAILPPTCIYPVAYQQQYWLADGHILTMREYMLKYKRGDRTELAHFDAPPDDLIVPDIITVNDFSIKRPSREVMVIIEFNGYKAHCVMKYLAPHIMEYFPLPGWQVTSVKFS